MSGRVDVLPPMTCPPSPTPGTSGDTDAGTADGGMTEERVERRMSAEFAAWEAALEHRTRPGRSTVRWAVYPHPSAPGGLPSGWQVRYSPEPAPHDDDRHEVVIIERAGGGWTMVVHWVDVAGHRHTEKWLHSSLTLTGLYATLGTGMWTLALAEATLTDFIVSHYNLSDPTEAAEATLVGLGARITVFPRALVEA